MAKSSGNKKGFASKKGRAGKKSFIEEKSLRENVGASVQGIIAKGPKGGLVVERLDEKPLGGKNTTFQKIPGNPFPS